MNKGVEEKVFFQKLFLFVILEIRIIYISVYRLLLHKMRSPPFTSCNDPSKVFGLTSQVCPKISTRYFAAYMYLNSISYLFLYIVPFSLQ